MKRFLILFLKSLLPTGEGGLKMRIVKLVFVMTAVFGFLVFFTNHQLVLL